MPQADDDPYPYTQQCPSCATEIRYGTRYTPWCECGWGLAPHAIDAPDGAGRRMGALYRRLQDVWGERIYREATAPDAPRRSGALVYAAAVALSLPVLGAFVLLVVGGAALLVRDGVSPLGALGLLLLGIAYVARPRVAPLPKDGLDRAAYPTLYALTDRVAASLETRPIDIITVSGEFNASFSRRGWARRSVLTLGLPLFHALDEQGKVALIAHELAHDVNGDHARAFLPATALRSLEAWRALFDPAPLRRQYYNRLSLLEDISKAIMGVGALLLHAWMALLVRLLWQDSQRGEYVADALGARIGGVDGMAELLATLHYTHLYASAVRDCAVGGGDGDIVASTAERIAALPARERERLRRVGELEGSRLDRTHPPTAYRLRAMRGQLSSVAGPPLALSYNDARAIDGELASWHAPLTRALVERYRRRLYY